MKKFGVMALIVALACGVQASWYWPFGSDDHEESDNRPRLSELMEPVSLLIDEASDMAAEGKDQESIDKYRAALAKLDEIEMQNQDRVSRPEFSTVRNKRAYVNAAIDSMLLRQVKANARAVAVSDTTELEKKLAAERNPTNQAAVAEKPLAAAETGVGSSKPEPQKPKVTKSKGKKHAANKTDKKASKATTPRERVMECIANGDFEAASPIIEDMLVKKPNDVVALNLKATMEAAQGKYKAAESTLDQTIMSNPRNYYAYYNMANLMLRIHPDNKLVAKRYYETGRAMGGPENAQLEEAIK